MMNYEIVIKLIQVNQPFGTFYISKMSAFDIYNHSEIVRKSENEINGMQRDEEKTRVQSVSKYCEDNEAIFPTPIVLSCNSDLVYFDSFMEEMVINNNINYKSNENKKPFRIIDGQHRILGINNSKIVNKIELPVVIILDMSIYQEAYVFTTINSNQKPVIGSLFFDLYEYYPEYILNTEKSCHLITKSLNQNEQSPFYNRIKMLGKKNKLSFEESLSQSTVADKILKLITNDAQRDNIDLKNKIELRKLDENIYIFRDYFKDSEEAIISKILVNYFNGVKSTYVVEWANPNDYLLSKSIGFSALMKFFSKEIYGDCKKHKNMTENLFHQVFTKIKNYNPEIDFRSKGRGSSESLANELFNQLTDTYKNVKSQINWEANF